MLTAGTWVSAPELVHIMLMHTAWKQAELDLQPQGVTVDFSRKSHAAPLGSMTFSNLPRGRLSCVRELVAPSYQGPCLHLACNLLGCQGNKLYIMQLSPLLMCFKVPHHSSACNCGQFCTELASKVG